MNHKHALIAIDVSNESNDVLEKAVALCDSAGTQRSLVTVIEPVPMYYADIYYTLDEASMIKLSNQVQSKLSEFGTGFGFQTSDCHVRNGDPAEQIKLLCDELDIDLLIIGSHARKGLKKLVLGSTASKVLNGVQADVFIVNLTN